MSEIVKFWIEEFEEEGGNLIAEIDSIEGTISNEEIWVQGSRSKEEADMHRQNIKELKEYLEWLKEKEAEI